MVWMEEDEKTEEKIEEETEEEVEKDIEEDEIIDEGDAESDVESEVESGVESPDLPEFLVSRQKYLASGIHIGMKQHTLQMKPFIYKIRPDGLAVMNLRMIDERIRVAAKFLARTKGIIVVSRRAIAHKAIEKFAEIVGAKEIKGRFMPGTLTNPNYEKFYEADVVLVVDPLSDYQAVKEAVTARKPIIAICDTFNETNDIDLIIPANNKGAKSVATLFWLLTREILKERGKIKSGDEYKYKLKDFMTEFERKRRDSSEKRPSRYRARRSTSRRGRPSSRGGRPSSRGGRSTSRGGRPSGRSR